MSAFQLGIDLAEFLSGLIDRAVVGRTPLRGQFDLYLELNLNWDYFVRDWPMDGRGRKVPPAVRLS